MINFDLQPFCDTDRPALATPWSVGDFTFACNARLLVRVSRRSEVPERSDAPDCEKLITASWPASAVYWAPLPASTGAQLTACEGCDGGQCKCPRCQAPHECLNCGGTGKVWSWPTLQIRHRRVDLKLVTLIHTLPGCVEAATEYGGALDPLCFRFPGGLGLLLPMRG